MHMVIFAQSALATKQVYLAEVVVASLSMIAMSGVRQRAQSACILLS
jgi:hypothetical protein